MSSIKHIYKVIGIVLLCFTINNGSSQSMLPEDYFFKKVDNFPVKNPSISSSIKASNGMFYFGGEGLFRSDGLNVEQLIDIGTKKYRRLNIIHVSFEYKDLLYINTNDGIYTYNLETGAFQQYLLIINERETNIRNAGSYLKFDKDHFTISLYGYSDLLPCALLSVNLANRVADPLIDGPCEWGDYLITEDKIIVGGENLIAYNRLNSTLDTIKFRGENVEQAIKSIAKSEQDKFLIGVENRGLFVFDTKSGLIDTSFILNKNPGKYSNTVKGILPFNDSLFILNWLDEGVFVYNVKTREHKRLVEKDKSVYHYLTNWYTDLALLSMDNYVMVGTPKNYNRKTFFEESWLKSSSCRIIDYFQLSDGRYLTFTSESGLFISNSEKEVSTHLDSGLRDERLFIRQVERLPNGDFIFITSKYLYRFIVDEQKLIALYDIEKLQSVFRHRERFCCFALEGDQITISAKSFILQGDLNGEMTFKHEGNRGEQFIDSRFISDGLFLTKFKDNLVRVEDGNINSIEIDSAFEQLRNRTYLFDRLDLDRFVVLSFYGDYGGIYNVKENSYQEIIDNLDITASEFLKLTISERKEILIKSNIGIIHLDSLGQFIDVYGSEKGINDANKYDPSKNIGRKGSKFFVTGSNYVDEFEVPFSKQSDHFVWKDIYVNNVKYLGQDIGENQSISLDHDENFLRITYTVIQNVGQLQRSYRYKLDNIDYDWVVRNQGEATYSNLESGRYTFTVQHTDSFGRWVDEEHKIEIYIKSVWYQTWWFYAGLVFMGLLTLFGIVMIYINYQKRNLIYEKRFAQLETMILKSQMNPHFIFNSLNSIRYLFMKDQKDKGILYITKFAKLLRSTLHMGEDALVKLSDEIDLTDLFVELEKLRFDGDFAYEKSIKLVDLESVMIPPFVIQPLVENAFWHGLITSSKKSKILRVSISKVGKDIQIKIMDNGVGFKTDSPSYDKEVNKKKSYGLSLIKERFELINKTQDFKYKLQVNVENELEGGTCNCIIIST